MNQVNIDVKNSIKCLFLSIAILFGVSSNFYGQEWLGNIVPMKTNLADLPKALGASYEKRLSDSLLYETKSGNLFIEYSLGNCIKGSWGAWDVSKETVLHVTFYPKKKKTLSYYNVKKEGLKEDFYHGSYTYTNESDGILFIVQSNKVMEISYFPPDKFKDLKCSE